MKRFCMMVVLAVFCLLALGLPAALAAQESSYEVAAPFIFPYMIQVHTDGLYQLHLSDHVHTMVYNAAGLRVLSTPAGRETIYGSYILYEGNHLVQTVYRADGSRVADEDTMGGKVQDIEDGAALVFKGHWDPPGFPVGEWGVYDLDTQKVLLPMRSFDDSGTDCMSFVREGRYVQQIDFNGVPYRCFDRAGQESSVLFVAESADGWAVVRDRDTGLYGVMDGQDTLRVPMQYEEIACSEAQWSEACQGQQCAMGQTGAVPVKQDGKWGAVRTDGTGELCAPLQYETAKVVPGGAFTLTDGTGTEVYNSEGHRIAPAGRYREASGSCGSILYVQRASDFATGGIDGQGNVVVPFVDCGYFESSGPYSCNIRQIRNYETDRAAPEKCMALNERGQVLIPFGTREKLESHNGALAVYQVDTWDTRYIDDTGREIPTGQYLVDVNLRSGVCLYRDDTDPENLRAWATDLWGNMLLAPGMFTQLDVSLGDDGEGIVCARRRDGKYGLLRLSPGAPAPKLTAADAMELGIAAACRAGIHGTAGAAAGKLLASGND